jgi:hypothetical protein
MELVLITHVMQPKKFNHQPHENHELFVRNSSFIRDVGVLPRVSGSFGLSW